MSSTITFTYGANVVTINGGRKYPEDPGPDMRQNRRFAMGGRLVSVTNSGTPIRFPEIHLRLIDSKYQDLYNFIYNIVEGSTNPFTFTDYDSSNMTVKYLGGLGRREAKRVQNNRWAILLKLAEVL